MKYINVLTIAGLDPSGGAGILADIKTFSALGCYGMAVLTSLTAQNTQGVTAVQELSADFVAQQMQTLMDDIQIAAIKVGMLYNERIILEIAEKLTQLQNGSELPAVPVVLDPVMMAKSGHLLLQADAIDALQKKLFPLATLITPNIPEAELLLNSHIKNFQAMELAAKQLCVKNNLPAALIKGGHLQSTQHSSDCLYIKAEDKYYWFEKPWINTPNTHGTGCTLSAAITAFLAKGLALVPAIEQAKNYLYEALLQGSEFKLGQGCGPVHHFYAQWD
jgi:hydroxymethylpyrimidine/phosphomethylpyrimidine kinase